MSKPKYIHEEIDGRMITTSTVTGAKTVLAESLRVGDRYWGFCATLTEVTGIERDGDMILLEVLITVVPGLTKTALVEATRYDMFSLVKSAYSFKKEL